MQFNVKSRFITAGGMTLPTVEAVKRFKALPERIRGGVMVGLRKAVLITEREVKRNVSGRVIKRQSGKLAQSITSAVDDKALKGIVGSPEIYARVQEEGTKYLPGGVIKPKRSKYLTIPIEGALGKRARNVPPARDIKDLVFLFSGAGIGGARGIAGIPHKGSDMIEPVFVLVKRVKIEPKFPFKKAKEKMEKGLSNIFKASVMTAIEKEGLS